MFTLHTNAHRYALPYGSLPHNVYTQGRCLYGCVGSEILHTFTIIVNVLKIVCTTVSKTRRSRNHSLAVSVCMCVCMCTCICSFAKGKWPLSVFSWCVRVYGCLGVWVCWCVSVLAVSAAMFFPARQMAQAPLNTLREIEGCGST